MVRTPKRRRPEHRSCPVGHRHRAADGFARGLGTDRTKGRAEPAQSGRLWAVFPTGRRVSAKARAFVAFIEGILAPRDDPRYSFTRRRSCALIATTSVLIDISIAPIAGESSTPHGASTP